MKWWRCLWLREELISAEMVEIPGKVLAVAREEGKTLADVLKASQRCVEVPGGGHACFFSAEGIEQAVALARKLHPHKAPS